MDIHFDILLDINLDIHVDINADIKGEWTVTNLPQPDQQEVVVCPSQSQVEISKQYTHQHFTNWDNKPFW